MSRVKDALPGCVFEADLNPNGMILDGSQFITYPEVPQKPELSICFEFYPNFSSTEDVERHFCISDVPYLRFYRRTVGALSALQLYLYGTYIGNWPETQWGAYWQQGSKNQIVITGTSGAVSLYLNSVLIATKAPAWAPAPSTNFDIGGGLGANFLGKITQFHIHDRIWTQADVDAWWNNSLFNYRNKASLYLPMRADDVSGTNTLDRSGNGNNGAYGAGVAAPTKLVGSRGYSFDGGDNMTTSPNLNHAEISFLICFTPGFLPSTDVDVYFMDSSLGSRYLIRKRSNASANTIYAYLGNTYIGTVAEATYSPHWSLGPNVIALVGATGDTSIWLNNVKIMDSVATAWTPASPATFTVGSRYDGAGAFLGDFHGVQAYPFALSPLQIAIEHKRLMSELHGNP